MFCLAFVMRDDIFWGLGAGPDFGGQKRTIWSVFDSQHLVFLVGGRKREDQNYQNDTMSVILVDINAAIFSLKRFKGLS